MITREEARSIAETEVIQRQLGFAIELVVSLQELSSRPPCLYLPAGSLERSWIAYVEPGDFVGLRSSNIIVIDQGTGQIVYAGSANDEG